MSNLTNKVLDEIRSKHVKPVPAWRFILRSVLAWVGFVLFVFLGAQAVSIILFLLSDHDWTDLVYFRGGRLGYFFIALPYLWVIALIALIVVAYLDFKKTKSGYRYRPLLVVGVVIAVSLLAGAGLHAVGMGKRADAMLEGHLPHYRTMAPRGVQIWDNPAHGRLMGQIEKIHEDGTIDLKSPRGEEWSVVVEPGMIERFGQNVQESIQVRVIGQPIGPGEFKAKAILPWRPSSKQRLKLHLNQNNLNREELLRRVRSTGERSTRPPVHPVAPTDQ